MPHIITHGYRKSITFGEFIFYPRVTKVASVQTVHQTRHARLLLLIKKHGGIPQLANALKGKPSEAAIRQIASQQRRKERGSAYNMGDIVARHIETTLNLEPGYMDTPPTYAELYGETDWRAQALQVMEAMPQDQWPTAVRLLGALAQQTAQPA